MRGGAPLPRRPPCIPCLGKMCSRPSVFWIFRWVQLRTSDFQGGKSARRHPGVKLKLNRVRKHFDCPPACPNYTSSCPWFGETWRGRQYSLAELASGDVRFGPDSAPRLAVWPWASPFCAWTLSFSFEKWRGRLLYLGGDFPFPSSVNCLLLKITLMLQF